MTKTVWFKEPVEHGGLATDSLVVERLSESETTYELETDVGETLTVQKENVDRIE